MKTLKVIVSLGLIPLCVYIGSLISLGAGNGAILGGILGIILCCILCFMPHRLGSGRLNGPDQISREEQQRIDSTMRKIQQAHIEDEIRMGGANTMSF